VRPHELNQPDQRDQLSELLAKNSNRIHHSSRRQRIVNESERMAEIVRRLARSPLRDQELRRGAKILDSRRPARIRIRHTRDVTPPWRTRTPERCWARARPDDPTAAARGTGTLESVASGRGSTASQSNDLLELLNLATQTDVRSGDRGGRSVRERLGNMFRGQRWGCSSA